MYKYVYNIYIYTAGLELRMSAQFSKMLWFELRMPAKWGILECRHMWHSKFQSWVRKPQYFPIFEAKTCHKQFIDWSEIYPKAFQVPSSTPSCMIRIAWGNHVYPSEGFYQNLEYIYIFKKLWKHSAIALSCQKVWPFFTLSLEIPAFCLLLERSCIPSCAQVWIPKYWNGWFWNDLLP